MQTFLPYPDFRKSLLTLDDKRLGKQRVETYQILNTLLKPDSSKGWRNHPAVKMWKGYEVSLARYYNESLAIWSSRGFNNVILHPLNLTELKEILPPWVGDEEFHRSHRANLLRKNPEHYSKYWDNEDPTLPYVWPER